MVIELLKSQIALSQGDIVYCEGETSTNLWTVTVMNGDYAFKHSQADTVLLSAYARLRSAN